MKSCSALYKTRKVQSFLKNAWKEESTKILKDIGTVSPLKWKHFKTGFKKGFMDTCNRIRTYGPLNNTSPKTRRK